MNDLRYALRQLVKAPGFTVVAVLSLALGVGANTAIFSFVEGVLLRPLPYADSDRLVSVRERTPEGYPAEGTSTLTYLDWENQQEVFECMAARAPVSVAFSGLDETTVFRGSKVTKDYFRVFGIGAALGRTFVSAECNPGSDMVVILSHSVWNSQFGADPNVIGRTITLGSAPNCEFQTE